MSVERATKHFINRDFSLAASELGSLPFQPQPKPWILYFALCDRAFVEPDRPAWPLNGRERKALRASIVKGDFWEAMAQGWQSTSASVPAVVATTAINVTAKHGGDPTPAGRFAEAYLADNDDPDAARCVATAFITHVLVELQHDYFYARELVNGSMYSTHESEREHILKWISEHETLYAVRQKEEADLLAKQEQERVAAAIAETQRPSETVSEPEGLQGVIPSVAPAEARHTPERRARISRTQRSLSQIWGTWFQEFIRGQGFYNLLAFVFMMCSLASSAGLRRQAAKLRVWLWAAIVQSLKMGLTVTYL